MDALLSRHRSLLATLPTTVLLTVLLFTRLVGAAPAADHTATLEASPQFQRLVTELVRGAIPHNYVDEKDWGKTKEVVRGLYIKREGLRIKTHRTFQSVNHGTWTRYRIDLLDPDEQFHIRLQHIRTLPEGGLALDIICDAKVRVLGRLSQWQQGVQWISLGAEADTDLRITMQCEVAARIDTTGTTAALELNPVVRDAQFDIKDFRMREISQLDGPLVKTLSASVREVLEDEIAKRRTKLVEKINRQIDKNRDDLRLSLRELVALTQNTQPGK